MKLKTSIYTLLLVFVPFCGFSKKKKFNEIPITKNTYIGITLGKSSSNLRDFATSPLIYRGIPTFVSFSRLKEKNNRENEYGISYSFGNYSSTVGDQSSTSKVKTFGGYYSKLYPVNKIKLGKWKPQIGGLLNVTSNLRINNDLGNNALGLDFFGTIFGSAKISRDVSRKRAKQGKIIFIPYHRKARRRTLGARLNVGLMNNTFRNGFAYIEQSGILNDPKLFDDYQLKIFSGLRLSTAIDYTIFLNNNAIRLSYNWDAYKTGGDLDKFEMAHHLIGFTFLLNTK